MSARAIPSREEWEVKVARKRLLRTWDEAVAAWRAYEALQRPRMWRWYSECALALPKGWRSPWSVAEGA